MPDLECVFGVRQWFSITQENWLRRMLNHSIIEFLSHESAIIQSEIILIWVENTYLKGKISLALKKWLDTSNKLYHWTGTNTKYIKKLVPLIPVSLRGAGSRGSFVSKGCQLILGIDYPNFRQCRTNQRSYYYWPGDDIPDKSRVKRLIENLIVFNAVDVLWENQLIAPLLGGFFIT